MSSQYIFSRSVNWTPSTARSINNKLVVFAVFIIIIHKTIVDVNILNILKNFCPYVCLIVNRCIWGTLHCGYLLFDYCAGSDDSQKDRFVYK